MHRCRMIHQDPLRGRVNRHVLGGSMAVRLRLGGGLVRRSGRLRGRSRSLVVDGVRCRIRLIHGGWACGVLLADLLLTFSDTTRSPEQAPKHARGTRLLLRLSIGSDSLSGDVGCFVLVPAEGSKQRPTALLLDAIGSCGASCASRPVSRCLEVSARGHYRGRRTAARSSWGPSRKGRLFGPLLSFNLFLLL